MNSSLKNVLFALISAVGLSYCFFTIVQFAINLYKSGLGDERVRGPEGKCKFGKQEDPTWVQPLIVDIFLIAVFVLQHTIMAADWWKRLLKDSGCGILVRSLYIIATSLALQVLLSYWQPLLPCSPLWEIWMSSGSFWSFLLFLLHALSWLMMLAISLTLDYAELMGVKQVYYSIMGLPQPLHLKSEEHKQLFCHFRHPFSSSFLIVLWVVPVMSLDRFILALGLTAYLLLGHSLDTEDYLYLKEQYELKEEQLWQARF